MLGPGLGCLRGNHRQGRNTPSVCVRRRTYRLRSCASRAPRIVIPRGEVIRTEGLPEQADSQVTSHLARFARWQ
jgi:hypothetical protein